MTQSPIIIGSLIGGLGLFLLAVGMMTDGLKKAAGSSLKRILSQWTDTPFKGVLSGFFMTATVQSSSAVTVASIGFVNAGLLPMRHALGILYGANIGTTVTGWLVALVGFNINIDTFALPMIGIGMLLHLVKGESRVAAFGISLVGFGLFFLGIDVLKNAFEGLVAAFDLTKFRAEGLAEVLICLLLGVVMTVLTQSSSASIALTITAAASGMMGINGAAAMVIGANVGTTSTALIASIAATANAKRVALAQVIFNVGTGFIALLILPLLFFVINTLSDSLGFSADPSISLALFHTVFNLFGVALVFPLNDRLADFLTTRFLSRDEKLYLPKYLDKNIAAIPVLAVNSIAMELEEIAQRVNLTANMAVSSVPDNVKEIHDNIVIVRHLSKQVSLFIASLERSTLSVETTKQLASLLRIDQYLLSCAKYAEHSYNKIKKLDRVAVDDIDKSIKAYNISIVEILDADSIEDIDQLLLRLQGSHDVLKAQLLNEGAEGSLSFDSMLELIDVIGDQLRMAQRWLKARKYLQYLHVEIGSSDQTSQQDLAEPESLNPSQ